MGKKPHEGRAFWDVSDASGFLCTPIRTKQHVQLFSSAPAFDVSLRVLGGHLIPSPGAPNGDSGIGGTNGDLHVQA